MPNPSNSDLVGEAVGDEFYGKHSWDRLINAPDYYEKPTPLELALRDALKDAAQQLEQAEQRIKESREESKGWHAEWTKVIKRERVLRRVVAAARSFVDDDEWQEHAAAALTPDEGADPPEGERLDLGDGLGL